MICPRDDDVFYGREFHLLDKGERFNLDSHLSGCPKCAERAEQLTRRLHCLKLLPEIEPSPGLADRVLERIHAFDRWRRRVYLICLAGIFLPSFFLAIGPLPFWSWIRQHPVMRSVLKGAPPT